MMKSILYVRLRCPKIYPVGPIYLADHVHKHFPEVKQKIIDLALVEERQEKKILLEEIEEFNPDTLAFSWRDIQPFSPDEDDLALKNSFKFYYSSNVGEKIGASWQGLKMILFYENRIRKNLSLINLANRTFPEKKILIGGPAFSVFAKNLIGRCPNGTVGIVGEGENVFLKLIGGKDILDERVVLKKNGEVSWGAPLRNRAKKWNYVPLENSTPVDFDYITSIFAEFNEYTGGFVGVPTKRGCPFNCLFCLYPVIDGKQVRYRPPRVVAQDVENLKRKFGVNKIWFCDSQFFPAAKSLPVAEETLDELIRRELDIHWASYIRIDQVTRPIAKKMLASGISDFELSITSGSQAVIDRLRLGFKLERFFENCQMLKEAGHSDQKIRLNLSLNAPGETSETLLETIDSVEKISQIFGEENVRPFLFFLAVQPRTGLAEHAVRKGYLPQDFNPLALNPFIIRNLIYNPPPLGKIIGQAMNHAMKNGTEIGGQVLRELKEQLKETAAGSGKNRIRNLDCEF